MAAIFLNGVLKNFQKRSRSIMVWVSFQYVLIRIIQMSQEILILRVCHLSILLYYSIRIIDSYYVIQDSF